MGLSDIGDMTNSGSLRNRIVAAAAQIGADQKWANTNLYAICATEGWDEKWVKAKGQDPRQYNPDTGGRPDVIGDEMIVEAVKARKEVTDLEAQPPADSGEVE